MSAIDYTSVASAGKLQPASKSATQQSSAGPATIVSENSTTGITTIDPSAKNNPDNSNNNTVAGKPLTADATLPKKAVDTVKTKAETNNPVAQQKPTPKPGSQKKSAFAITITALPDLSVVGTNRTGKIKMGYGAGLSYTLNRITFRSGFYVGKKVYTAGPDEYHSKNPWPGNFILDKVDADCKVYEIPFLLSYNFSQSKRSNWFFSSGLSTYLMKRETYGYYYEYRGSPTVYQKTTTINNEYKHFFSIVNLSAGYERKLNNRLSITAEPYIKVPLDGIGYGKIQLNSAGVAVTLSVKPFAPKK